MSVIVYRDGVMAADTRAFRGSMQYTGYGLKWKIKRLSDGSLAGVTSSIVGGGEQVFKLAELYVKGEKVEGERPEEFTLMLVRPNGEVFIGNDSMNLTGPIDGPFIAIGSGHEFALGALACHRGAVQAVEIACQFDPMCGLPVRHLRLHENS